MNLSILILHASEKCHLFTTFQYKDHKVLHKKIAENKKVNDTQVKKNAMIKCITFLNNNNDLASQVKVYVNTKYKREIQARR